MKCFVYWVASQSLHTRNSSKVVYSEYYQLVVPLVSKFSRIMWICETGLLTELSLHTRIKNSNFVYQSSFFVLINSFPYVFVCLICLCDRDAALNQVSRGLILQYTFLYFVLTVNAFKFQINSKSSWNTKKFDYKCVSTIVFPFEFSLSLCLSLDGLPVSTIFRCLYLFYLLVRRYWLASQAIADKTESGYSV